MADGLLEVGHRRMGWSLKKLRFSLCTQPHTELQKKSGIAFTFHAERVLG